MNLDQSSENYPKMDQPAPRGNLRIILAIIVPIFVLGSVAAAWLTYPPLSQTITGLFTEKHNTELPSQDEDIAISPEDELRNAIAKRDQDRFMDINLIRIALADYFSSIGEYPKTLDETVPKFMSSLPKDPNGEPYGYRLTVGGYALSFTLESDTMDLKAGTHELSPEGYDIPQETPEEVAATDENGEEPAGPISAIPVPEPEIKPDSDGDGLDDQRELTMNLDPMNPDTDSDGLSDGDEVKLYGTNPLLADTDGDGFNDGDELASGFDPRLKGTALKDSDNDGIYDLIEIGRGLNPNSPDTDNDGLADGDELNVFGTSPVLADTDGDGYDDGDEISGGFNPLGEGLISTERRKLWNENESVHGLHEPTLTTLGK